MSMPAALPSISPNKWLTVPLPAEAMLILPGAALADVISSAMLLGAKCLLASTASPDEAAVPMLPPAPGRLSTMSCWPSVSDSFCATMRAIASLARPATWGTTRVTGLLGYLLSCARAGVVRAAAAARASRARAVLRWACMGCLLGVGSGGDSSQRCREAWHLALQAKKGRQKETSGGHQEGPVCGPDIAHPREPFGADVMNPGLLVRGVHLIVCRVLLSHQAPPA